MANPDKSTRDPINAERVPHGDRRAPASQVERDEILDSEQGQEGGDASAGRGSGPKKTSGSDGHADLPGDPRG